MPVSLARAAVRRARDRSSEERYDAGRWLSRTQNEEHQRNKTTELRRLLRRLVQPCSTKLGDTLSGYEEATGLL